MQKRKAIVTAAAVSISFGGAAAAAVASQTGSVASTGTLGVGARSHTGAGVLPRTVKVVTVLIDDPAAPPASRAPSGSGAPRGRPTATTGRVSGPAIAPPSATVTTVRPENPTTVAPAETTTAGSDGESPPPEETTSTTPSTVPVTTTTGASGTTCAGDDCGDDGEHGDDSPDRSGH